MCGMDRNTVSQSTLVQISSLISQEISRLWAVHKRRLLKAEGRGSKMLIYIVKRRKMVRERHKIRKMGQRRFWMTPNKKHRVLHKLR